MTHACDAARLDASRFSTDELCKLYRILDNLEETANMAHQYLHHIMGRHTATSKYVDGLQEYLSAERWELVSALRERPASDDDVGQHRLSVILQYEAWCRDFHKGTVQEFAASTLSREAV